MSFTHVKKHYELLHSEIFLFMEAIFVAQWNQAWNALAHCGMFEGYILKMYILKK